MGGMWVVIVMVFFTVLVALGVIVAAGFMNARDRQARFEPEKGELQLSEFLTSLVPERWRPRPAEQERKTSSDSNGWVTVGR